MDQKPAIKYASDLLGQLRELVDIGAVCAIYGDAGRTSLIRAVHPDAVILDAREILEPKNLGGLYAIHEGDVRYVRGILVEHMLYGRKVCFKNVDLNTALLQYLRPLMTPSCKIIANDGQTITPHPDFRLLLTVASVIPLRNVSFVGPVQFSTQDVFDSFGDMKESVVGCLRYIYENRGTRCLAERGLRCDALCLKNTPGCCDGDCLRGTGSICCGGHFRMLCALREFLFALCEDSTINATNANRCVLYQGMANIVLNHDSPALCEFLYAVPPPLSLPNLLMARTEPAVAAIRALLHNIKYRKPTLLVGETGAGKTALVQYLSANSAYFFGAPSSLKVVNMSSDFDSASLIGGYQSVNFDTKIRELYKQLGLEMPPSTGRKFQFEHIIEYCTDALADQNAGLGRHCTAVLEHVLQDARLHHKILNHKLAFYYKEGILAQAMREGAWLLLDEVNLAPKETLGLLEALLSRAADEIAFYEVGCSIPFRIHKNFMIFACMNPFGDYGKKQYDSQAFNRLVFYDFSMSLPCVRAVVESVSRNMIREIDKIAEFYFEFKKGLALKQFSNVLEPLVTGRTLCRAVSLILQLQLENHESAVYTAFNLLFFTQLDLGSRAQAMALFKKYFTPRPKPIQDSDMPEGRAEAVLFNEIGFIVTPEVQIHMDDVEMAIRSRLPVLLQGDTSTGKTSLIYALAKKHGVRVLRVNNHEHTDASDYIGNYTTTASGIAFKDGVLLTALRTGCWLILDELNLAPSDVLEVLNRLLDDNREVYVPETDEVVRPHPKFRIFATQNVHYGGRQGLAKSFRNRFVEIFFAEKAEGELREILEKRCRLPAGFTKLMMSVYSTLRIERTVNSLITLRDLFKWAHRGPCSYYEVYEIGLDILMVRQRTADDRKHIFEVFNSIFADRMKADRKVYPALYTSTASCAGDYVLNDVPRSRFEAIADGLIVTPSYLKLIGSIYKAWSSYEPVLIIGETGLGKTRICKVVADLFKVQLKTINMHAGTESSDFVGHFTLSEGTIGWTNGILVEAMISGHALLIDEINLAEDAVLERMNSAFEDRRHLYVTETSKEIQAHDHFRIVATMNPGGDYGKREISPALRNRCTEIFFCLEKDEYLTIFDGLLDRTQIDCASKAEYRALFRGLDIDMSIRKVELIVAHIDRLHQRIATGRSSPVRDEVQGSELYIVAGLSDPQAVWNDVLELLMIPVGASYVYKETDEYIGVAPYFLRKPAGTGFSKKPVFCFSSETIKLNLQRIIRGLTLGRGILLSGEPGVGKTSIVQAIAAYLGIRIVRINLSEQTEMSDLVGAYLPVGPTITFVESEMVAHIRKGYWIILDEINLCTQSVIEGLNSMLDHRRTISVDGISVAVHPDTRIFGTMNPTNHLNGRKQLPKSFLDRFIVVPMAQYNSDDMRAILAMRYGESCVFDETESLRGNIKLNELARAEDKQLLPPRNPGAPLFYSFTGDLRIGQVVYPISQVDESYVLIHAQIPQVEMLIRCFKQKLPVILTGDIGRMPLLNFVSKLAGLQLAIFDCHSETDTCDLLGQYQKSQGGDALFEWCDSYLVRNLSTDSLIAINQPELVEKSVFDRLSSLFESGRFLSIYERGLDTAVSVSDACRLVLCCDNPALLSPAFLDRCVRIDLSSAISYIDLYKIFSRERRSVGPGKDDVKRLRPQTGNCRFRQLTVANRTFAFDSLDYAVRLYDARGIRPSALDMQLPIYNALLEEHIDALFRPDLRMAVHYDKDQLAAYRYVSSFASPLPRSCRDRVLNLKKDNRLCAFIKNLFYADDPQYTLCCRTVQSSVRELKEAFIRYSKSSTIAQLDDLTYFASNIAAIKSITDVVTEIDYVLPESDPLLLVKAELEAEKAQKENRLLQAISETARDIYKYGSALLYAEFNKLHAEYDRMVEMYSEKIVAVSKRLGRDYERFRVAAKELTFCEYFRNAQLREFMEDFSDISDYLLTRAYMRKQECVKCVKQARSTTTKDLAIRLLRRGEYCKCTNNEYARYVYGQCMGSKSSENLGQLVFEAICFEEPVPNADAVRYHVLPTRAKSSSGNAEAEEGIRLEFTNSEIDACLQQMFPKKTTAQIIETRGQRITVGQDLPHCPVINGCNVMTTPEKLIEHIHTYKIENESKLTSIDEGVLVQQTVSAGERTADALEATLSFLTGCYKKEQCLIIDKNYRYFLYLLLNPISAVLLESFFLGCAVYEFIDRMYFAQKFLQFSYSDLLYNIILQYKAFELEETYAKKTRECRVKLFKEPRLFESIIHAYVDRFLYIPVTSLLSIRFEAPGCQSVHDYAGLSFLLKDYGIGDAPGQNKKGCECIDWVSLSRRHNREVILAQLRDMNNAPTKEEVIHRFYHRRPAELFSYSDVCLSKVFSTVIENINKNCYSEKDARAMLSLLDSGLGYPFPPFLYFIYKFADNNLVDVEEGVAIKNGEGLNNMQDEIREEDICDDVDNNNDQADNAESEAIEMDNTGEMQSVSGESQGEEDVDGQSNSGDDAEEDFNERGATDAMDEACDADPIPEPDAELGSTEEGEESATLSEEDAESELVSGSAEDADSTTEIGAEDEEQHEEAHGSEPNENNNLEQYEWREESLNRAQTCDRADGYSRKVEGGNAEEKDALTEGVGDECIEGEGLAGDGASFQKRVLFPSDMTNCVQLADLLRIILASNRNNKYKGDYKSGKKLNLKKIIPYIASDYRKDRIWMKRQKNDKKDYTIRLFIDNSKSMFDQRLIDILGGVYYKLTHAFSMLGVPVQLYRFGEDVHECTVADLTFADDSTSIHWLDEFSDGINIIITDGVLQNTGAFRNNFLALIVDKGNIRKMSKVSVIENRVFVKKYLDTFALRYCILNEVDELEHVFVEALGDLIRQIN